MASLVLHRDHQKAKRPACLRVHHSPRMAKCASALALLEAHFELAGATRREQRLSFARKNVPEIRIAPDRSRFVGVHKCARRHTCGSASHDTIRPNRRVEIMRIVPSAARIRSAATEARERGLARTTCHRHSSESACHTRHGTTSGSSCRDCISV